MKDNKPVKEPFCLPKHSTRSHVEREKKETETRRRIEDILEERAFNKLWYEQ